MTVVKKVRNWRATAKELIDAYDGECNWIRLGTDLDALQRRHNSDEECLNEIVKIFLQRNLRSLVYGPPSWQRVIKALYVSDEIQLARQFRNYCEPLTGALVLCCTSVIPR